MENYLELERILKGAFSQCSQGKGKERHADDEPFQDQKICVMSRWLEKSPCAGPLFQAAKKIFESSRLQPVQAIRELQGAIVYAAAAILLLEEKCVKMTDTGYGNMMLVNPCCSDCTCDFESCKCKHCK